MRICAALDACVFWGSAQSKFLRLFIYCFSHSHSMAGACGWSASSISIHIVNDGVTHQTHHNGNAFHLHLSDVTISRQYRSKHQRTKWSGFVRCTRIFPAAFWTPTSHGHKKEYPKWNLAQASCKMIWTRMSLRSCNASECNFFGWWD